MVLSDDVVAVSSLVSSLSAVSGQVGRAGRKKAASDQDRPRESRVLGFRNARFKLLIRAGYLNLAVLLESIVRKCRSKT